MEKLSNDQKELLTSPLPDWAIKPHPSKTYLSVINPMAIVDRLNEVFGIGQWVYETEHINFVGKFAVVKGTLTIGEYGVHLEQFGGNDNPDVGDAYKGASTDALTKISSYLGIGASIYKGQGNTGNGLTEIVFGKLRNEYQENGKMTPDMQENYAKCSPEQRKRISDITKALRNSK